MTKNEFRKESLAKRKSLSEEDYIHKCQQIYDQFFTAFDLSFVRTLHTFLPLIPNKEPDTWIIIDRVRREFPNVKISIPKIDREKNQIISFYFEGLHQLKKDTWGIYEPSQGIPTNPYEIDMILVPLLTFDLGGYRIGYGKGYYDKFLATCRPDCVKIGLSLLPPENLIPHDELDIALDSCITPQKVYRFTSSNV